MKDVGLFFLALAEVEAVEAGVLDGSVVVARLVTRQRRRGVDSYAKQVVRPSLEERERFRSDVASLGEEVGIADLRQLGALLFARQAGEVIHLVVIYARNVAPRRIAQRRLRQEFGPWRGVQSGDEAIVAEGFAIEKYRCAQLGIKFLVIRLVEDRSVDAEIGEQGLSDLAVLVGTLDRLRASVAEHHAIGGGELVALGVSSEVVVIVEDEDARLVAGLPAIEVGSGQSADAASHDDEVVGFGGVGELRGRVPEGVIAQSVRVLVGRVVAAAESGESGGIVAGTRWVFRRKVVERGEQRASDAETDAIQEVAPRDVASHAQFAVVVVAAHFSLPKPSCRVSPAVRFPRALLEASA